MKPIDYLLIGGVSLVVIGVIFHLIQRKKVGKGGCGCGCKGCPVAGECQARKGEKKNDEAV